MTTPTIISLCAEKVSITSFYDLEEEEENLSEFSCKEIKLVSQITMPHYELIFQKKKDLAFNLVDDLIICKYKVSIFIPPPNIILKRSC
ncbi:hypothetical protein [Flavobacterium sp. 9AF]|uniref:hypothetical protein n=1 Tax=Flavobacterium sp. 9AF TaxID=2653142 RepID=UPI00135C1892|nr:hypothetical protein [Flavobacterium sp. 9AF]